MADIELEAQITLNVTRDQAKQSAKKAATDAGKQVAKETEDGFVKGLEKAAGQRLRKILGRFGPLGQQLARIRIPALEVPAAKVPITAAAAAAAARATGGIPTLSTLAKPGGGAPAGGGAIGRVLALVGKAGLVIGAALLAVGAAGLAFKSLVTRLLNFGRSLSSSSGLIAATFARLDIRMQVLRARIGNRLAPQMDRLANSVGNLLEQMLPLVPAIGLLLGAVASAVEFISAALPGGRRTPGQAGFLAGLSPLLALIQILEANTSAVKDNTLAQQDFEIPPEQAQLVPDFIRMIIRGAPQVAPAGRGQPAFAGGDAGQAGVGGVGGGMGADGIANMIKADLERTRRKLMDAEGFPKFI